MRKVLFAVFAAALTLTPALTARADDPTTGEVTKTETPAAKTTMTLVELGQMFKSLGYNPEPIKNKDGKLVAFKITVKRVGRTVFYYAELSPNGDEVWFNVGLDSTANLDPAVAAEVLQALLNQGGTIRPAYFEVNTRNKRVFLVLPLRVKDVTPSVFRDSADTFGDAISHVVTIWEKAVEAAKEAQAKKKAPVESPIP
jgi:hypothetical protein